MKKLAALTLSLFLISGTAFADSPKADSGKDSPKESDATSAKTVPPAKAAEAKTAPAKTDAEIAAEIEELRQAVQAQQEQLQMLKEELAKRDRQIEAAREAAAGANARASEATLKATEAANASAELKTATSTLNTTVTHLAASNAAIVNSAAPAGAQEKKDEEKGPTTLRYKGVSITPGGFLEAATVTRTKAQSSDINTQFGGIPYNGNSLSKVTESNFTARQSRITTLIEGKLANVKLSGYYEADFLGAGTTSNNRQSNSYVYRQRQLFGRADFTGGFSISAGQMWTLATENSKGIVNRGERLPMQIDPQYVVGFTWQRAYGFRVVKNFEDKLAIGFSVEGPQTTIGGRGFTTRTSTSALGVATTSQNFWLNAPGNSGGLYNAFDSTGYTPNKLPDFIAKLAVDPGWGHYEVFGIFSDFRNRVYPCAVVGSTAGNFPTPATPVVLGCPVDGSLTPSAKGAFNDSRFAGGIGGSATAPLFKKKFDLGLKVVAGDGIGRYGSAQIADVTARPDGTLAPIRTLHYLASGVLHPTPKLDIYAYWGSEFGARAAYKGYEAVTIANTPAIPGCGAVGQQPCPGGGIQPSYPALSTTTISTSGIGGYGSPYANNSGCGTENAPTGTGTPSAGGTCAGDIRIISEATLGFWHKVYQGEHGRMQWGVQYSYIFKNGWSGNNSSSGTSTAAGISPKAVDNMIFTGFRYYLP